MSLPGSAAYHEAQVLQMIEMGFIGASASAALKLASGDMERALVALMLDPSFRNNAVADHTGRISADMAQFKHSRTLLARGNKLIEGGSLGSLNGAIANFDSCMNASKRIANQQLRAAVVSAATQRKSLAKAKRNDLEKEVGIAESTESTGSQRTPPRLSLHSSSSISAAPAFLAPPLSKGAAPASFFRRIFGLRGSRG
mmetsp:Transcript_46367/g.98886  ORF Transcript_46367/g.98886 Transcript_46367/m.98886 type:complete len:199 (-) Transcript_46367:56-652(-)